MTRGAAQLAPCQRARHQASVTWRRLTLGLAIALPALVSVLGFGCERRDLGAVGSASASASELASSGPVDHGELDTQAPAGAALVAARVVAGTIYKDPNLESQKLGYVRIGGKLARDPDPVKGRGCKSEWWHVYPMGHVCSDEFTTDVEDPIVRASSRRPRLDRPLPYAYGFVRATAPQYLRVPSRADQQKSEMALDEHLTWYAEHKAEVQGVVLGANDVPLDRRGFPAPGDVKPEGFRVSTELSENELFGGATADDPIPFWLEGGRRSIPNVSAFTVPEYAVFADRVRRKTGLSFVGAFDAADGDFHRRFAVTVDLRLIPTTKVKPDTGSPFHGVEITDAVPMPFAFVSKRDSKLWRLIKGQDLAKPGDALPHRVVVPLSGNARVKQGRRFYQTARDKKAWLQAEDIGVVARPEAWPEVAEKNKKWIEISLRQQTLVLWEGKRAVYATLVSTGRDGLGDPKTTLSTPMGTFRLQSKHIAAAMDSDENSSVAGGSRGGRPRLTASAQATTERLLEAERRGDRMSEEDQRRLLNVKKGRDPEYGVTQRRGSQNFELRDVPWIQYFAAGYALHGAYWHDVFGTPRSHGCVNLAPIDARLVFAWTDPPVPLGWHGMNVTSDMGEGTTVVIHE